MIRVLVVDDHELVRRGVCSLLASEPSIDLCGEAVDGRDAIQKARELRPNLVLMDITMPNLNGLEATREIKRILPDTEVLVVSQHDTPEMVRQAFHAGARGYVAKSAVSTDLLTAIAKLRPGEGLRQDQAAHAGDRVQIAAAPGKGTAPQPSAIEKALRASEERFRSAMSSMAEGLFTTDTEGLVTYVNVPAERMFGWRSEDLIGKRMHEVSHYMHPDGSPYPAEDCPGLQVLQHGKDLREHEDVFIRKDGTFFPVVFSASPMEIDGNIVGLVVSFRDDTKRRQAEQALRDSERIFRAIGDSIDYGVWICDANARTTYISPSFLILLGLSPQDCAEHRWLEALHPDEREATIAAWQQCIREGKFWERESRFKGTDGEYHYVLTRGGPIRDAEGKITNWVGINLDIQNRKKSELALQRTSTQFQVVTDTMAVAVTRCSRDLRFLWVNPRYAKWIGMPAEEIVGRPIVEVLGKDRFDKLRGHIEKVLRGEPVAYQEQVSFKGLRERWISVNYAPTFGPEGVADGWVSSIVDITERKQQEAELAKQSRLLDFSFNAVMLRDEQNHITYWNRGAEELYGWSKEEALGQISYSLLKTQFPEPSENIFAQINRGEPWQGELVHTHKDGRQLTVLSRWALTRDPETNTHSISEINIDITKTKEAERQLYQLVQTLEARILQRTQQLENATEKLRELSGRLLKTQDEERRRIARELHDGVGQLLAALKMNLSKLAREKDHLSAEANQSLEENNSLIEQASQEIRTMSHLLHPPLLDEVGLESALRWYVDGFSERSKINVGMVMPPGFAETLPRDLALALFRIVQECLTNVHRHSGSETAMVAIERLAQEIRVEVSDEGKGIPQVIQESIVSGQSSGVGLRGMRERIRQFGGRLEIRSLGNGTSVISVLPAPEPIITEAQTGPSGSEHEGHAEEQAQTPVPEVATVLCIDDEVTGLQTRKLLLESAGHRVLEARSGVEGIRLFQSERVDVVILDYWMSGMKGTTVASELKRINPNVPIIVLSGMSDLPGEAAGLVDQWLVKGSHRAEQLLESVSALLERRLV
jgi:PAS domain S-box-containing protein